MGRLQTPGRAAVYARAVQTWFELAFHADDILARHARTRDEELTCLKKVCMSMSHTAI